MHVVKIPYIDGKHLFYWKNESSGKLKTTISKLLEAKNDNALSSEERLWVRSYFVHWAFCPLYQVSPELQTKFEYWQKRSQTLDSVQEFWDWLDEGIEYGVDPL